MSADDTLAKIEAVIAVQDDFEEGLLSRSDFDQTQKDIRLLATRRSTLSRLRGLVQVWREALNEAEAAAQPSVPAHDHEWDDPCTIACPWRQYLIRDVLAKSDPSEPSEIPDNETDGQLADRLAEMSEDEPL